MTPAMEIGLLIAGVAGVLVLAFVVLRPRLGFATQAFPGLRLTAAPDLDQTVLYEEDEQTVKGKLDRRLHAAGLEIPRTLFFLTFALIFLLGTLVSLAVFPRVWWAAPLTGAIIAWLAYSLLADAAQWRAMRFESRLVDAIDLMVAALTAGQNPGEALASAAEGAQEPVRTELREVASRLSSSLPIERSLSRMIRRYDSEGVRLFSQVLIVKWDVGGPLAPALQAVNRTARHGLLLRRQLRAHLAGAQTTAIVIAILPYVLFPILLKLQPAMIGRILNHPWGPGIILSGVLLQLVGFMWLRRLMRTDV